MEYKDEEKNDIFSQDDNSPPPYLSPSTMTSLAPALSQLETSHVPKLILRNKIVVIGDACVGKSAICQMFHSGCQMYPKNYVMTCGVDFLVREIPIPETNAVCESYLYDCGGQSIFNQRQMAERLWENASYVMCVFDVSSRESFQSCAKWVQQVRAVCPSNGGGQLPGILVANKIDLREGGINSRAVVDSNEALHLAQQNNLEYFECSAFTGRDVEKPFNFLAMNFYNNYQSMIKRASAQNY